MHISGVKLLLVLSIVVAYFSAVPYWIVKYGIDNHYPAFDNGAPFSEVFSVFSGAWLFGHMLIGLILLSLYMLLFGCND